MKNEDTLIFECVRERDIDFLLMEEWCVNPAFAQFFFKAASSTEITLSERRAMHSVSDAAYGENDIVLTFRNGKQNVAILVEDKIDAVPQPDQAKRYKLRAEKITASEQYDKVFICLVAPQHYLDNDTEPYPCRISYETIASFLADGTARGEYKANVLRLAISQERRRALPVKNDIVTEFWQNYHAALMAVMPDAIMPYPKIVPINSDWPMIRFPGFSKKVHIVHKMAQGNIDLETGLSESESREILSKWDTERIMVAQTGKSFVLRIPVPPLDRMQSFDSQESQVHEAFAGIRIFHDCMRKYGLSHIVQSTREYTERALKNEV